MSEDSTPASVPRLVSLLGQVLQEVGGLMQSGRTPALPAEPAEPVEPSPAVEIERAVEEGFDALFTKETKAASPASSTESVLYLVYQPLSGRRVAVPWGWVVDTHLDGEGVPEAFTFSHAGERKRAAVKRVIGVWTADELRQSKDQVEWVEALADLESSAPSPASPPDPPLTLEPRPDPVPDRPVWVVSPSALARRFLMRHLDHIGLSVQEARDLDDLLLPADLESAGALFLDESLQEHWRDHPSAGQADLPLVFLTVDGRLEMPSAGGVTGQEAVLPRPFERSEVESVVGWLRSVWSDRGIEGCEQHGDEEDDTWLFADPFGNSGAREHPGGG